VAEDRRGSRPQGGRGQGGRPSSGRPSSGRPSSGRPSSSKPTGGKPTSGKPASGKSFGKRTEGSSSGRPGERRGGSSQGGRPSRDRDWKRPADKQGDRSAEQSRYDGPPLPEDITGRELDRAIAAQLKGLPEKLAARVARHLVAAGRLIDSDPETAYQHTLAARSRAARLAVVREATGEAAYAAGHYAEALSELRAAKRMNGATAYLPIMADCHRALGQPQQALKLAKSPGVANFAPEAKAEMTIVESGARRDMGQLDAALRTLELAPLQSKSRAAWVVRLRYAYADTLEAAGRPTDALAWFHRTHAIDSDEITDAAERAELLERAAEKD
jgi:tetratricopeptide (TPR) repeat protein